MKRKGHGWRTEYEDEGPCAITYEEEDNGGAAPATAEGDQELDECKDEKNGFKRNEGGAVKDQGEDNRRGQEDMGIRKDDEARWGTNHGAGGVKTYTGDNNYESDKHGEILEKEKNKKWDGDIATAIVKRMYSKEVNKQGRLGLGKWLAYRVR